jgi:hypothetical protein
MRTKTKTGIMVIEQGSQELDTEFTTRIQNEMDKINEKYPHSTPITIPSCAADGSLTLVIQWQYDIVTQTTSEQITELTNKITETLGIDKLSEKWEQKKETVAQHIREFFS